MQTGTESSKATRRTLSELDRSEALELRDDAFEFTHTQSMLTDERRKMRARYGAFGAVLIVILLFSLCVSNSYYWTVYSPLQVIDAYGTWFNLTGLSFSDPDSYMTAYLSTLQSKPYYADVVSQVPKVFKYLVCGILLALSGALYQNAFKNPIAAPSMLGVTNGVSLALLVLVLWLGQTAQTQIGLYYLFAYIGGIAILLLVLVGGRWISGPGSFNVVSMLLMGTIVSQLLGVVLTYVENTYLTEASWAVFYRMQSAVGIDNVWTYVSLAVGAVVAIVPVVVFRFRLNLISFTDEETRLLGVNPNKLRILALACGSIMILTAQVNAGQVAMASLVVPFVARAVFGSEFRKQLMGNVLIGAILLLLCGDLASAVYIPGVEMTLGTIVTVFALPLFVWMLAIRQRSWE